MQIANLKFHKKSSTKGARTQKALAAPRTADDRVVGYRHSSKTKTKDRKIVRSSCKCLTCEAHILPNRLASFFLFLSFLFLCSQNNSMELK